MNILVFSNEIMPINHIIKSKDVICPKCGEIIRMNIKDLYFSYGGKAGDQFNKELTFEEMINSEDKTRNKMNILVFRNELENCNAKIKSKVVICPICGESIRMDITNCKIKLSQCINKHTIDNILLDEFEESQKIDNSQM